MTTEMTMPAMASPLPLPYIFLERFKPMILKISPKSGMKKEQTKPAIAMPLEPEADSRRFAASNSSRPAEKDFVPADSRRSAYPVDSRSANKYYSESAQTPAVDNRPRRIDR